MSDRRCQIFDLGHSFSSGLEKAEKNPIKIATVICRIKRGRVSSLAESSRNNKRQLMKKINRAMLITHIFFYEKLRHRRCAVDLTKNEAILLIFYYRTMKNQKIRNLISDIRHLRSAIKPCSAQPALLHPTPLLHFLFHDF